MRLLKQLAFAAAILGIGVGLAWAQTPGGTAQILLPGNAGSASGGSGSLPDYDVCELINQLRTVFQILRVLCYGGAAFVMMGWAWGFITSGDAKLEDAKKKGVSLIVSFLLLFGVGTLMTYMPGVINCDMSGW